MPVYAAPTASRPVCDSCRPIAAAAKPIIHFIRSTVMKSRTGHTRVIGYGRFLLQLLSEEYYVTLALCHRKFVRRLTVCRLGRSCSPLKGSSFSAIFCTTVQGLGQFVLKLWKKILGDRASQTEGGMKNLAFSINRPISLYFGNDTRYVRSYNGIRIAMRTRYRMAPFLMTLSDP